MPDQVPTRPVTAPARVVLIGAGGLGCAVAPVLAAAPIPLCVEVVDDDVVEVGNLHRQVLHRGDGASTAKAPSLAGAITRLAAGRGATARATVTRFTADNARALCAGAAVVIDGSDNYATRFLANDGCVLEGVPLVHAASIRWQGQVLAIDPRRGGPCYRCLFEAPPDAAAGHSCAEAGVFGPVCGVVGALAAEAALDLLAGRSPYLQEGGLPLGQLLVYDGLGASDPGATRVVRFRKNPSCIACGQAPLVELLPLVAYEVPAC